MDPLKKKDGIVQFLFRIAIINALYRITFCMFRYIGILNLK